MIKKIVLPLFLLFGLSACGDTLDIKSKPVEPQVVQPENPAPVKMYPVQWTVVTKDTLKDFISKISSKQSTDNFVFIAIDSTTYENIRLNFDDLRRYIQQQQAIIVYYKNITTINTSDKK